MFIYKHAFMQMFMYEYVSLMRYNINFPYVCINIDSFTCESQILRQNLFVYS